MLADLAEGRNGKPINPVRNGVFSCLKGRKVTPLALLLLSRARKIFRFVNLFNLPCKDRSSSSAVTGHASDAPPRPRTRLLLLAGDDVEWLGGNEQIAGRKVVFAPSLHHIMPLLEHERFDALVAGYRDPGRSVALLDSVVAAHPTLVCAMCADSAGPEQGAYPVLRRAESLTSFEDALHTVLAAARWNRNPAMATVAGYLKKFPALPSLYNQINAAMSDNDVSMESIADLISHEPAITARLLHIVNSPIFALRQRVASVRDSAALLGLNRLRSLVLATSLFDECDASRCRSFSAGAFEIRSIQIATWASNIASHESGSKTASEMAFTAGLLHQFGVLLLAANLPDGYDQILSRASAQRLSIARLERENYGVSHAELAGAILATWRLPFPIINAVGFYALPSESEDAAFSPLTAVHAAHAIDNQLRTGVPDFDRAYLERLNFLPRFEEWSRMLAGDDWRG